MNSSFDSLFAPETEMGEIREKGEVERSKGGGKGAVLVVVNPCMLQVKYD